MVEEVTIELNVYEIGLEHALLGLFWGSKCWEAKKRLTFQIVKSCRISF